MLEFLTSPPWHPGSTAICIVQNEEINDEGSTVVFKPKYIAEDHCILDLFVIYSHCTRILISKLVLFVSMYT